MSNSPSNDSKNMELKARGRLLETASDLFYERGFTNVGINEIFEQAGVSRGTLYYNFGSKTELIRAVLEQRLERRLEWLKGVETQTDSPQERLQRAVELHIEWMKGDAYRGCSFLNAIIELGDEAKEVKDLVLKQKEAVRSYLAQLAAEADLAEPERVSHELMLIIDGATVTALFRESEEVAQPVRSIFTAISNSDRL